MLEFNINYALTCECSRHSYIYSSLSPPPRFSQLSQCPRQILVSRRFLPIEPSHQPRLHLLILHLPIPSPSLPPLIILCSTLVLPDVFGQFAF